MKRILIALIILAALALGLAGCGQPGQYSNACTFKEEREATISAADAKGVNVKGAVGTVRVIGRANLTEVRVKGEACGTTEANLAKIKVTTERSSDGWVRVLVDVPRGNNKLDLVVEVPQDLQLMARNDVGLVDVSHVYRGANVRGDVGTVTVTDVKGGLTVENRSGAVTLTDLEGNVNVTRADSGALVITGVKGDVTFSKKNGLVTVNSVTGDLTARQKVNGLVSHTNVSGKVSIPK